MNLWAVIPSRNRMATLEPLVRQLVDDNVHIVIVNNGYEFPELTLVLDLIDDIVDYYEDPPNISRMWNIGLQRVERVEDGNEYTVAVLNDDLVLPDRFVSRLANALEQTGAAAAYPDQHGFGQTLKHEYAGPISLFRRMTGYAFALRGSAGIYADETMKWWYSDDDIDWRARQNGGSVLVGGLKVEHLTPNQTTVGELAVQAGLDRETFIKKWGRAPW